MNLIFGLLASGVLTSVATEFCQVFEQQVIIPWRSTEAEGSSALLRFVFEECQRFLRERKEHESM